MVQLSLGCILIFLIAWAATEIVLLVIDRCKQVHERAVKQRREARDLMYGFYILHRCGNWTAVRLPDGYYAVNHVLNGAQGPFRNLSSACLFCDCEAAMEAARSQSAEAATHLANECLRAMGNKN